MSTSKDPNTRPLLAPMPPLGLIKITTCQECGDPFMQPKPKKRKLCRACREAKNNVRGRA